MFLTDYHVHSLCSPDGQQSMADMAAAAAAARVDEICITDHVDTNSWRAYMAKDTYDWTPVTAA